MSIAITKMSANGQVVIPADIREEAKLKPATQFLVFNEGDNILLKHITKEELLEEFELMQRIERSEEQFQKGESVELDTKMSVEEMDKALMESK